LLCESQPDEVYLNLVRFHTTHCCWLIATQIGSAAPLCLFSVYPTNPCVRLFVCLCSLSR
jgi:hypothetical protein